MTRLVLVRHGQASATGPHYDALSAVGHQQAALLGKSWCLRDWRFERILVGPRKRQRQTEQAVRAVFEEQGLPWPDTVDEQHLDEHHGPQVARWHQGRQDSIDEPLSLMDPDEPQDIGTLLKAYMEFMEKWITATHASGPFESWADFRERAARLLDQFRDLQKDTAAFTSGGVIAAVVGSLLGLDSRQVLHLSYTIGNCAWTEIRRGSHGLQLVSLNQQPDFPSPDLYTRV